jgi:hypothetical protein
MEAPILSFKVVVPSVIDVNVGGNFISKVFGREKVDWCRLVAKGGNSMKGNFAASQVDHFPISTSVRVCGRRCRVSKGSILPPLKIKVFKFGGRERQTEVGI